ncbi:hypothetical protein [Alteromonas sp. RKMC-009]|uniref:hypothetical protein n=1 Tax=Alteromonas sp. RKMC-009 TaxID=2267264 RepID=UPI000E680D1E|nr:hypothetical protein [Alteromonas sp. RKMC-009]AYA64332.1 hypothetical protein DS731_10160 [Alteromonas sp. RKMC-009]
MGYVISASTSTVPLYDEYPEPALEAIHSAIFSGDAIRTTVIDRAMNGMNKAIEKYYQYGKTSYVNGVPKTVYTGRTANESSLIEFLTGVEGRPITVDQFKYGTPTTEQFIRYYLNHNHGLNLLTGTVTSLPAQSSIDMDEDYNSSLADAETQIREQTDALKAGIPVDREESITDIYEGETVTRVDTYVVLQKESVKCIGSKTRSVKYVDYEVTGTGEALPVYTLNMSGYQDVKCNASGSVSYQETRTRKYVRADGTETGHETTVFDKVKLSTGLQTYTYSYTYPYSDDYTSDYQVDMVYTYVEYSFEAEGITVTKAYIDQEDMLTLLIGDDRENPFIDLKYREVDIAVEGGNYPVVFLRHQQEDYLTEARQEEVEFTQAQHMLDMFGIDILELRDNINENEDVNDIDEAYFMLAIQLNNDSKAAKSYAFDFWLDAYENSPETGRFDPLNGTPGLLAFDSHVMAVTISDAVFDLQVMYAGIGLRYVEGVLDDTGEVSLEYSEINDVPYLTYKKQIDDNTYAILKVADPMHRNTVYGDGVIETRLKDYWEDDENHNFIIPLRRDLVQKQNPLQQEQLHYVGLMLVFHAYDKRKTKWYESSLFKAFLIVVAIVVIAYTGYDIYTSTAAAFAQGGTAAAATYLATVVLTSIAINIAIKYTVKVIGPELAFLVAVVTIVAAMYGYMSETSFLDIDPKTLLSVGTSIGKENNEQLTAVLQSEMEAFEEEYDLMKEDIETLKELLSTSNLVDPYSFINRPHTINLNETADQFLQRSLISNPGVLAYDLIDNYVATQVQLPKPQYT